MSESRYWQIVNNLVGSESGSMNNEIGEELVNEIHAAHAAGEYWAAEVLMRWDREGATRDYNKVYKDLNSVTLLRRDGRKVRKTTSYSRPVRSPESGEIVGQQMQTWWGMTRPELVELHRDLSEQHSRLADALEILAQIIAVMDRHPGVATAREAWEADGRDIGEVDLGQVGL